MTAARTAGSRHAFFYHARGSAKMPPSGPGMARRMARAWATGSGAERIPPPMTITSGPRAQQSGRLAREDPSCCRQLRPLDRPAQHRQVLQRGAALGLLVHPGMDGDPMDPRLLQLPGPAGQVGHTDHVRHHPASRPVRRLYTGPNRGQIRHRQHGDQVRPRPEGALRLQASGIHDLGVGQQLFAGELGPEAAHRLHTMLQQEGGAQLKAVHILLHPSCQVQRLLQRQHIEGHLQLHAALLLIPDSHGGRTWCLPSPPAGPSAPAPGRPGSGSWPARRGIPWAGPTGSRCPPWG